jgi:hypothetical protein
MSVEGRLQHLLVQPDPGLSKLVAVLPLEAGRLHDAADDGGVKQFLKGSRRDVISQTSGRRMAEFAGEQEEGRSIELCEFVKLVRVQVTKVDLGARRLKIFVLTLLVLRLLLNPTTWLTARGHFF